jgi:5-formyltetrahydrofolate cyclo-ligase
VTALLKGRLMTSLEEKKAELRKAQAALRKKTSARYHDEVTATLATFAGDLIKTFDLSNGDIVAGFWPIHSELDIRPLMNAMIGLGMRTSLPATPKSGKPLIFHVWQEGDPIIKGPFGTSEPEPTARVVIPRLALVPMLAFDDAGYRLGYGGGFYDRTLAELRNQRHIIHWVGIAYDIQLVDAVPIGDHDARLDGILTESGLWRPAEQN